MHDILTRQFEKGERKMDFRIGKVREHRIWSSIEKCFICVSLLLCVTLAAGTSKRNIRISGDVEKFSDITIVKGNKKPLIGFAAAEMQNMIFKAVGKKPQIVNQIMPGRLSIVLGDCGASRKAGLDITKLPPEGFYIRRNGNVIYIAGRDHASYSPAVKKSFSVAYPRGTLTGLPEHDFSLPVLWELSCRQKEQFIFPGILTSWILRICFSGFFHFTKRLPENTTRDTVRSNIPQI